jgi:hypothetical protein
MVMQRSPLRERLPRLPRFVTTRGGGYFFVPSLTALRLSGRARTRLGAEVTRPGRAPGRMRATTPIAPVKDGHRDVLEQLLREIGSDFLGNSCIRFGEDSTTHFAQAFVFDRPARPARLVYSAIHNDDEDRYLDHLRSVSPGLDTIWDNCVGYRGRNGFHDFARRCSVPPAYTFAAYPHETVTTIMTRVMLRQRIEEIATPRPRSF